MERKKRKNGERNEKRKRETKRQKEKKSERKKNVQPRPNLSFEGKRDGPRDKGQKHKDRHATPKETDRPNKGQIGQL